MCPQNQGYSFKQTLPPTVLILCQQEDKHNLPLICQCLLAPLDKRNPVTQHLVLQ